MSLAATPQARSGPSFLGRSFVHPLFDYLLIGGGLSLIVTILVWANPEVSHRMSNSERAAWLAFIILASNSAHFAASTVRLYTKPGAYESMRFVTMGLPLVMLVIVVICLLAPVSLGRHLMPFHLTWSPYHYAAQAYGLAVMYCYRSGCLLSRGNKRMLWWFAMLPFFYMFVAGPGTGIQWLWSLFSGGGDCMEVPALRSLILGLREILPIVSVCMPVAFYFLVWYDTKRPPPLIGVMMLFTNAIWFAVLSPLNAFIWATIFHGIQYLAIVILFHLRDQLSRPDNRHGWLYHTVAFYSACVLLGYGLFNCLPFAFYWVGLGLAESWLFVAAAINIHHFIVDAYIWRLRKTDSNRRIVSEE